MKRMMIILTVVAVVIITSSLSFADVQTLVISEGSYYTFPSGDTRSIGGIVVIPDADVLCTFCGERVNILIDGIDPIYNYIFEINTIYPGSAPGVSDFYYGAIDPPVTNRDPYGRVDVAGWGDFFYTSDSYRYPNRGSDYDINNSDTWFIYITSDSPGYYDYNGNYGGYGSAAYGIRYQSIVVDMVEYYPDYYGRIHLVANVPEPSTLFLLGSGLVGLLAGRRMLKRYDG